MLGEEAGDLIAIADELERRALSYEKVIAHLDLPRARHLRALATRIRDVVATSEGDGDRDAVHGEVVGLRLEAMCALLEEPLRPAPGSSRMTESSRAVPSSGVKLRAGAPSAEAAIPIGRMRRRGS